MQILIKKPCDLRFNQLHEECPTELINLMHWWVGDYEDNEVNSNDA